MLTNCVFCATDTEASSTVSGGFFANLLNTEGFPPRWHCGIWSDSLGWLHIVSDVATALAYYAIPILLLHFMRKRKQVRFPVLFWLFSLFIAACGTVHLIEATIFWHPVYRLSGLFKALTALVSWATVIVMWRIAPQALELPEVMDRNVELSRSNFELTRANENLDHFARVASHDLRAPLRGIHALARWLEEDEKGLSGEGRERLRELRGSTEKLDHLLVGLLKFARQTHGKQVPEWIETGDVLRDVLRSLRVPAGTQVETGDLPRVFFDPVPLRQIFQNLLANAFEYLPATGGLLRVEGNAGESGWDFRVSDNGPGIPPEHRDKVFDLFCTLGKKPAEESRGVGLSIVWRLLEQAGGRIHVEETPGGGATFVFHIPHASGNTQTNDRTHA